MSRIEDAKESLLRSHWDLIIVDEAHKMSAYSADKKTLTYQLGESLSQMTDHYLLMTATPHKGDPENFCLFLSGSTSSSTAPQNLQSTLFSTQPSWTGSPSLKLSITG